MEFPRETFPHIPCYRCADPTKDKMASTSLCSRCVESIGGDNYQLRAELEELKREHNHAVYCRDVATRGRTLAENQRDRFRKALEEIVRMDRSSEAARIASDGLDLHPWSPIRGEGWK